MQNKLCPEWRLLPAARISQIHPGRTHGRPESYTLQIRPGSYLQHPGRTHGQHCAPPAARTMARMPARVASGRSCQPGIASAKTCAAASGAPHSAPLPSETAGFPRELGVGSIPFRSTENLSTSLCVSEVSGFLAGASGPHRLVEASPGKASRPTPSAEIQPTGEHSDSARLLAVVAGVVAALGVFLDLI